MLRQAIRPLARTVVACALSALTLTQGARAAGFALIEQSVPDMGTAYAGSAARAGSPDTLFFNPAGMTRLPGTQAAAAVQVIFGPGPVAGRHGEEPLEKMMLGDIPGGMGRDDLRRAMSEILGAFRPGRNAFLTKLLLGQRVEKILFAATKADHLHHSQHKAVSDILAAMLRMDWRLALVTFTVLPFVWVAVFVALTVAGVWFV